MPDIFISYSRQDSAQATQLSELLGSAGLNCWMDTSGIEAAASWSKEIVQAIDGCKAFLVLLSPASVLSSNVVKEVSIAAEQKKKILPLDLEPVALSEDLRYHLAGLQRTAMTNIDSIIRALGKLGLEATKAPEIKLVKETDSRKSLMILPFQDLSPTGDNGWFADGIVSELIAALSNVKSLKLADNQATREFRNYRGQLPVYAREMSIRYFVEGDVRKFGDNIKVSARLLDIETGDHLWQDSMKGTMTDIFDFQEQVAQKVLEGMKLHLTGEEKAQLAKRGTENAEAYELYMKGSEYFTRHTRSDFERAMALYEEAVHLDPNYAVAHGQIANTLQALYRMYSRDADYLDRAEPAAERVREIEGESAQYAGLMSLIRLSRGDAESSLQYARRAIELDPKYSLGYSALCFAFQALGDKPGAVEARKEQVRLPENNRSAHFSLLVALNDMGEGYEDPLRQAAERAVPIYERYIRLTPDDYNARVQLAGIHLMAGRMEAALAEAEKLSQIEALDGFVCYNLACIFLRAGDAGRGFAMLRRAVENGFRNIDNFRRDPDLAPLRDPASPFHGEFEKLVASLE